MTDMYRQGDLLIVPVDRPMNLDPKDLVPSGIVELGETTGHAHRLIDGEVFNDGAFLRSNGIAQLVHEEHDTIVLPEGEYRVLRQRELLADGDWGYVYD